MPGSPFPRQSSHSSRALRGFAVQFVALTILPLTALLVVIALGSITIHQRGMRSLVGERDERAVRAAAAALSERLTHRAASLRALADRAAEAQGQSPGLPLHDLLTGSAYLVGGFGFTALNNDEVVVMPVRSGLGARLGLNLGYLKFTPESTWNPF